MINISFNKQLPTQQRYNRVVLGSNSSHYDRDEDNETDNPQVGQQDLSTSCTDIYHYEQGKTKQLRSLNAVERYGKIKLKTTYF